jgi:hypothetical protein
MNLFGRFAALGLVFVSASCRNSAEPNQRLAVGAYFLESVSGRGPVAGSMLLIPGGQVERRVRYRQPDGSLSSDYIAVGTYRVTGTSDLEIGLRENGGTSTYVWKPLAKFSDGVLSLQYPDPADGPNIVERYKRR